MAQTWTVGQTAGAGSSGQRRRVQQDLESAIAQTASDAHAGAVDRDGRTGRPEHGGAIRADSRHGISGPAARTKAAAGEVPKAWPKQVEKARQIRYAITDLQEWWDLRPTGGGE